MRDRIESAWERCQDLVTDYEGAASEAYLPDVHLSLLYPSLQTICSKAKRVECTPIWSNDSDPSVTEKQYDLLQMSSLFEKGYMATLNFLYTIELEDFDFNVHLMIDLMGEDLIDVEIIWWSDLAFQEGVEKKKRFVKILEHFIYLQELFRSKHLYIGPENTYRPKANSKIWTEV